MKTLVSILLLALGVVAAIQKPTTVPQSTNGGNLIFLCKPKYFSSPRIPNGYNVVGISAKVLNYTLGDTSAAFCYFEFYRKNPEDTMQLIVAETQNDYLPASLLPLLFSRNKQNIFFAAKTFATAQGYVLDTITSQTHLNALYP
ncbi:hypothetical protein [Runella zeae]|uniref:hypothetical protein n=1 Tax=Runella zeae TaxID=94255 RepID=UPI00048F4B7F|nr:hypothetical protein [Runella zeae]